MVVISSVFHAGGRTEAFLHCVPPTSHLGTEHTWYLTLFHHIYIYIYIYTHTHTHIHTYIDCCVNVIQYSPPPASANSTCSKTIAPLLLVEAIKSCEIRKGHTRVKRTILSLSKVETPIHDSLRELVTRESKLRAWSGNRECVSKWATVKQQRMMAREIDVCTYNWEFRSNDTSWTSKLPFSITKTAHVKVSGNFRFTANRFVVIL
jgi:hypothetical protein